MALVRNHVYRKGRLGSIDAGVNLVPECASWPIGTASRTNKPGRQSSVKYNGSPCRPESRDGVIAADQMILARTQEVATSVTITMTKMTSSTSPAWSQYRFDSAVS